MGEHAADVLADKDALGETCVDDSPLALSLLLAAAVLPLGSCTKKTPSLNLLVWEGYADPSFVQAFEEQNHCKVCVVYGIERRTRRQIARRQRRAPMTLFLPQAMWPRPSQPRAWLRRSIWPNFRATDQLSVQLTSLPLVRVKGEVFGVPFMWGPDPMIYDTTVFPQPPDSWNIFWDPKYRGKVSVWDDLSTVYMAAQVLGFDHPDPSRLYNLSDDQLEAVKKKLLELKPNIRKMWSTGGELTNLFQNHEVVLAMGWPLMTNQLRKLNFPVGETIPKENTTGWIDHLMITAGSENQDLAYKFLEYMIEAQTQKNVTDVTGYTPANPQAARFMTPEQIKGLHLDDIDNYQKRLYFWQDVPRRAKYNEIWNEVKAAQ